MIDSHAHLDSPRYDEDRAALLARAFEAGIHGILTIGNGDGPADMHRALEIARQNAISRQRSGHPGLPQIWATAGVHPHEARLADEAAYAQLDALLHQPEVLACGEIGLDYFYDHSPRDTQRAVFLRQMEIAAARRKPIVIHCRPSQNSADAWDDTLDLIRTHWSPTGLSGVLHCFTGELRHAHAALDLGFCISFAGNITFPKAQAIRDAALAVPLDRMLIETDAPFLAPLPNRGKRNEPAWVREVAATIAQLRGLAPEEVDARTTENFRALFEAEIAPPPHTRNQERII